MISKIGWPEFNPRRTEVVGRKSAQLRWVYDDESLKWREDEGLGNED